jgi:hypothetical protein
MKTLLMVKPDTVAAGNVGDILALVERNRFQIRRLTLTRFSKERAERFYEMHRSRPFFGELVTVHPQSAYCQEAYLRMGDMQFDDGPAHRDFEQLRNGTYEVVPAPELRKGDIVRVTAGEVTLRGRVLPIGGLKEKILAAHRAGVTTVLIPEENRKDLKDVPDAVLEQLTVIGVKQMDEVLRYALAHPQPDEFLREPSSVVDWRIVETMPPSDPRDAH